MLLVLKLLAQLKIDFFLSPTLTNKPVTGSFSLNPFNSDVKLFLPPLPPDASDCVFWICEILALYQILYLEQLHLLQHHPVKRKRF